MKIETKVIHAGVHPDPSTGAIMTPIFQTSTYAQESPGDHKGYEYARSQNPTRTVLERNLAALENGVDAVCFASGLAAQDAMLKLLKPGDEIISTNDLYGGSYRQMVAVYKKFGIVSHFVDMQDLANVEEKINENTKLLWIETPTNPVLKVVDIQQLCDLAKKHGIKTCVDNTFATPFLQNPIDLGADFVLHSATKYLGGHSDSIHGAVVCKNEEDAEKLHYIQNASGAVPGPMDCFLILRGIKTLHLRVERSCENAHAIFDFLKTRPEVDRVIYPGDPNHQGYEIAKRQMRDFGGMVSFDLKGDNVDAAMTILSNTKLFTLAESLGGVESLIGHPASMTHGSIPRDERYNAGLTDSLVRLSVGIENIDDLIEDLSGALSKL